MRTDAVDEALPGVFSIALHPFDDPRGRFLKVLHSPTLRNLGFRGQIAESYVARSRQGVLRGFHLQTGPCAHTKLVVCLEGAVLDVALDVRSVSPSYGKSAAFELSGEEPRLVHIGPGIAHAYYVRSPAALVLNMATAEYCEDHEEGWRWDSVDVWPDRDPILSEKDKAWPRLPPATDD